MKNYSVEQLNKYIDRTVVERFLLYEKEYIKISSEKATEKVVRNFENLSESFSIEEFMGIDNMKNWMKFVINDYLMTYEAEILRIKRLLKDKVTVETLFLEEFKGNH